MPHGGHNSCGDRLQARTEQGDFSWCRLVTLDHANCRLWTLLVGFLFREVRLVILRLHFIPKTIPFAWKSVVNDVANCFVPLIQFYLAINTVVNFIKTAREWYKSEWLAIQKPPCEAGKDLF